MNLWCTLRHMYSLDCIKSQISYSNSYKNENVSHKIYLKFRFTKSLKTIKNDYWIAVPKTD